MATSVVQNHQFEMEQRNDRFFGKDITNIQQQGVAQVEFKKQNKLRAKTPFALQSNSQVCNQQVQQNNECPESRLKHQKNVSEVPNAGKSEEINQERLKNCAAMKVVDQKTVDRELKRIENEDKSDPRLTAEYCVDIFDFLRENEKKYVVNATYMANQHEINKSMRIILVDWLVKVHQHFKLLPETLFLTISIIDRFLEKEQVNKEELQLVGISSLFISCKYEEIYPPTLKDMVEVAARTYTRQNILDMEGKIICTLNFNITVPTSLRFLDRYCRIVNFKENDKEYNLCRYLLELAMLDVEFLKFTPSNLACSAIYLTNKIFKKDNCWSEVLAGNSKYNEAQVRICAQQLFIYLDEAPKLQQTSVREKFMNKKYQEIGYIQINKIQKQNEQI